MESQNQRTKDKERSKEYIHINNFPYTAKHNRTLRLSTDILLTLLIRLNTKLMERNLRKLV